MFNFINQNILGFDVSVSDGQHSKIVESSEKLVGVYFDKVRIYLLFFNQLVKIVWVVVHNDIEILVISLMSEVAVLHHQIIRML